MGKLPTYELRINEAEDSIVDAIALVEQPAIEADFIAFSKHTERLEFAANDDKMELIGPAMIPDMMIYRKDPSGEEYNVYFTKDTIRQVAQVFMKRGLQANMNMDHSTTPAKSYVFQSFIVDSSLGINSPKGQDLPDGTWVVGVKVQDKQVWQDIKEGRVKGFSIEGMFQFFNLQSNDNSGEAEILIALQQLNNLLNKKQQ